MFLLWISPCAGPHDSFSTDILKGPNSPLPHAFSPLPFLYFSELRLPLLDCLSLQCLSVTEEWKLNRRKEWSFCGISIARGLVLCGWSSLTSSTPLLVVRGEVGHAQVLLWVLVGGSAEQHPQGGKLTSRMRGSDKVGGLLHWWEEKKVEREKPACAATPHPPPLFSPPFPILPHRSLSHALLPSS